MKYPSYPRLPLDESWDAIIIGSGIGGLAAAALLSLSAGKRVLVLERHYTAGGYTHVFHRPGYEWDVGLHYIGQVHDQTSTVRKAFDLVTNGQLQWEPMPDVYDRFVIGNQAYEFVSGTKPVARSSERLLPTRVGGNQSLSEGCAICCQSERSLFCRKGHPAFRRFSNRWMDARSADVLGKTDHRRCGCQRYPRPRLDRSAYRPMGRLWATARPE